MSRMRIYLRHLLQSPLVVLAIAGLVLHHDVASHRKMRVVVSLLMERVDAFQSHSNYCQDQQYWRAALSSTVGKRQRRQALSAALASNFADFAAGGAEFPLVSSPNTQNATGVGSSVASDLFSDLLQLPKDKEEEEEDVDQMQIDRKKRAIAQSSAGKTSVRITVPFHAPLGIFVCEVGIGRSISYRHMSLDTLQEQELVSDNTKDANIRMLSPDSLKTRKASLDPTFRGLLVTAVDPSSFSWKQGMRPGDLLRALSATVGGAIWPKSTLEGVRSALTSRRLTSSTIDLEFIRSIGAQAVVDNEFELTLTRPIGLLLKETDEGRVLVQGFSHIAPKFVQYAVKAGDFVVAVDSTMGDRMWPVSTVEGVISACTSRLPGQSVTLRFQRPSISEKVNLKSHVPSLSLASVASKPTSAARNEEVTCTSTNDYSLRNKRLLSRCRELLKRYVKAEENNFLLAQSKFRGKYALPAIVADKVVDALTAAQATLDCVTLSMIMDAYLSCRLPDRALQVFEAATGFAGDASLETSISNAGVEKMTILPNDAALNLITGSALLKAHALRGDMHSVSRVVAALESRSGIVIGGREVAPWPWTGAYGSIQLDTKFYNIALSAYEAIGGENSLQQALGIFDRLADPLYTTASESTPTKDAVSFNTLISMLSSEGKTAEAFELFYRMKRYGSLLRPDKYTYTSLIKAMSNQDDIQELIYDMRGQGVDPDVVTYNTMIKSLCESKRWTQAIKLVAEMETRRVDPDSMTYGYLMNAMIKTGKPNACLALFESAVASPKASALTENVYLYTTAITAASMLGDYERALELVSRMNAMGIQPNIKTLTAVMGACLSSDRADLAAQLFRRIQNPDGYAMAQGIQALSGSGSTKDALSVLQAQYRGVRAVMTGKDVMRSYHCVVKSSLLCSDFDSARIALADLFSKGYIPSRSIITSYMDVLRVSIKNVSDDEAKKIALQRFSLGLYLIDSFGARMLPVDCRLYTSLLYFASREGGLFRQVTALMVQSKASKGSTAGHCILSANTSFNDVDDAIEAATVRCRINGWEDLLLHYDDFRNALRDDSAQLHLPQLLVQVATRDIPSVLRAERVITSRRSSSPPSSRRLPSRSAFSR